MISRWPDWRRRPDAARKRSRAQPAPRPAEPLPEGATKSGTSTLGRFLIQFVKPAPVPEDTPQPLTAEQIREKQARTRKRKRKRKRRGKSTKPAKRTTEPTAASDAEKAEEERPRDVAAMDGAREAATARPREPVFIAGGPQRIAGPMSPGAWWQR